MFKFSLYHCKSFKMAFLLGSTFLIANNTSFAAPPAKVLSPAASPYAQGVTLFKQGNFVQACNSFAAAVKLSPADSNAAYYYGLSLQYCRRFAEAKAAYTNILARFPGTPAAYMASRALSSMQPRQAGARSQPAAQAQSDSDRDPSLDTFPDECYVPFDFVDDTVFINASVNRKPIKMIFDTGAEMCAFGNNHLAQLGMPMPTGKPSGQSVGVGERGAQYYWDVPVELSVGPITRRQFTIESQRQLDGEPLLGQTFFQDFRYTIDNNARTIHFVRKNKAGLYRGTNARETNGVPFKRMGNEMVVEVLINGKRTSMIFDTGAAVTCLTQQQVKELGINIPADAQTGIVNGVAGPSPAKIFDVQRIQCGPIDLRDAEVYVPDTEKMGIGLLGQTFYQNYQYTIDYDRGVINFLRR